MTVSSYLLLSLTEFLGLTAPAGLVVATTANVRELRDLAVVLSAATGEA